MKTGQTFHERAAAALAKVKAEAAALRSRLEKSRQALQSNTSLSQALEGLGRGWRHQRVGKYGPTWYFLRYSAPKAETLGGLKVSKSEMCWLAELADDPEEMRQGRRLNTYSDKLERVPVAIATFEEIEKAECPACKAQVPLVECMHQTRDSYDYDVWETWHYALCLECETVTELKHDIDEY
ncbi:MAG: hypothetical protein AAB554_01270 [Patescibacteria group bacterium]